MSVRWRWLGYAVASALAVGAGAAVLALAGSPVSTWVRNPIAWVVGALLALAAARLHRPWHFAAVIGVGLATLAATFAAAPVEGIHRWLDIGPLHINAAALVLPPMLASLARAERTWLQLVVVAVVGIILVLQPDASQATAFAAGAAVLLVLGRRSAAETLVGALICAAIAIAGWLRPDTLEPVAEVEGIFRLAAQVSVALAAIGAAALAAACLSPLLSRDSSRDAGAALATYFAISALAPLSGAYPVPLVGLGMSFPVGWWLGVAVASTGRAEAR